MANIPSPAPGGDRHVAAAPSNHTEDSPQAGMTDPYLMRLLYNDPGGTGVTGLTALRQPDSLWPYHLPVAGLLAMPRRTRHSTTPLYPEDSLQDLQQARQSSQSPTSMLAPATSRAATVAAGPPSQHLAPLLPPASLPAQHHAAPPTAAKAAASAADPGQPSNCGEEEEGRFVPHRRMATLPELVRHPSLAEADVPMADMGHPGGFARADSCLSGVDAPDAGPGAPWHSGGLLSPQGMARKFQFRDKPWFTSQTVSAGQAAGMPDPALDPSPSTLMRAGSFDPMKAWLSVTTRTDNSRADGLQSINFLPEG
ncbi:hypothetical protein WJX73_009017 [Symbiochloris irregularis]|uniref:Uncharacterized protein n=1 Tax=Symbiochloris irregularis TaxID=706552 RepID=A0AAW1PMH6_9CHLO